MKSIRANHGGSFGGPTTGYRLDGGGGTPREQREQPNQDEGGEGKDLLQEEKEKYLCQE